MVNDNQAEIEFLVKQEVSKAIKKMEKDLKGFDKNVKKTSKNSEKNFLSLSKVAEGALGFSVAGAVQAVSRAIVNFGKESVLATIQVESQFKSLQLQTGNTADSIVRDLTKATKGLVSNLTILQATNRALALGLKKDDLPGLFEAAAARARVLGISVEQATNDIVTGIGRQSPLILDNLGIVFDAAKTYAEYAEQIGKTTEALTKQERIQALTNQVVTTTNALVIANNALQETNIDRLERVTASWLNFKDAVGETIIKLADPFLLTTEERLREMDPVAQQVSQQIQLVAGSMVALQTEADNAQRSISTLRESLEGISGRQTEAEVDAQRELNVAKRDELSLIQQISEIGGTERLENLEKQIEQTEALIERTKQVAFDPEQIRFQESILEGLKAQLDDADLQKIRDLRDELESTKDIQEEQRLIIELQRAERQVALDEAVEEGEDRNLLEKDYVEDIGAVREALKLELEDTEKLTIERQNTLDVIDFQLQSVTSLREEEEKITQELLEQERIRQRQGLRRPVPVGFVI